MVKPQLGHDQVVSEKRWSLNTGGHKSRFHCIPLSMHVHKILTYSLYLGGTVGAKFSRH